jgi:SulP family sulfate permease
VNAASVRAWVPILSWARRYRVRLVRGDVLAAVVVVALAVPQALGYATIAGVPVVVGIYAIPAALIAYAIFGSSPHLVVGPVSTVSAVSGSLVAGMSGGDPARAVTLTAALAIGCGLGLLVGGLLRLGWAAEFISRPIVTGFVFGLVLVIILGEIPKLLGITIEGGSTVQQAWQVLRSLGDLDPTTAAFGILALVVLFGGNRILPRFPWGLLVLVVAILASSALDLAEEGVAVVGEVPSGLPPISLPGIEMGDLGPVLLGGLAMALVGLAEGLSAARVYAAEEGYRIDTDQEFLGTGAANVASGMCGGLGVAGSLSKTAASRRAGGHTQMTGIIAAGLALAVLVLFASTLAPLPRAVLSAIVIQAVWGLMDLPALQRYLRIRRNDFNSAVAALVGVVLFGPLNGLLIAIGLAVLGLVYRSSRIDLDVMGKVPGEKAAWGSIDQHPERRTYDGIMVIRLDAPLFWANATATSDGVLALVDAADEDVHALLLDLEATSQLDITSTDALEALHEALQQLGVDLYLVRVFYRARRTLARAGFIDTLGEDRLWHSISAGVRAARKAQKERLAPAEQDGDGADQELSESSASPAEHIATDSEQNGGYGDWEQEEERSGIRRWLSE